MADQTTLGNGRRLGQKPARVIRRKMSSVAGDIASLAELQMRLFRLDFQEAAARLILPAVFGAIALVLALGCVPVALLGFGYLLRELSGLSFWASFLIVAGGAIVVVAALLTVAWFRVRSSLHVLHRSQEELKRNIRWIKQVLSASAHTTDE
jgi:hypothetical protein